VQRIADAGDGLPLMLYLRNDGIGLDASNNCAKSRPLPGSNGLRLRRCALPKQSAVAIPTSSVRRSGGNMGSAALCRRCRGFTSGLINVWPEHSVAIHAALEAGDYPRANQLIDVMSSFEEIRAEEQNGTNVTAVKGRAAADGDDCDRPVRRRLAVDREADDRTQAPVDVLVPDLAADKIQGGRLSSVWQFYSPDESTVQ